MPIEGAVDGEPATGDDCPFELFGEDELQLAALDQLGPPALAGQLREALVGRLAAQVAALRLVVPNLDRLLEGPLEFLQVPGNGFGSRP